MHKNNIMNKKYYKNLKESITLGKFEFSLMDDAKKANERIKSATEAWIDMIDKLEKTSTEAGLKSQDLYDKLQDIKKENTELTKLVKESETLFEKHFSVKNEVVKAVDDAVVIFDKIEESAKDLGVDANSIPEYARMETQIKTSINLVDDFKKFVKDASRNIASASEMNAMIKNLK